MVGHQMVSPTAVKIGLFPPPPPLEGRWEKMGEPPQTESGSGGGGIMPIPSRWGR